MAGTWTAVPLAPYSFNSTPNTGVFNSGTPGAYGYDSSGTGVTAWGTAPVAVAIPNTGSVILWWYCGATAAGATMTLVGEQVTGQVVSGVAGPTIVASSTGWFAPYSPATYNVNNVSLVAANSIVSPGPMPAAYAGCFVVQFTTVTTLLVRAYSFSSVLP